MRFLSHIFLAAVLLIAASSCSRHDLDVSPQEDTVTTGDGITLKVSSLQKGKMRIYVS